MTRVTFPDTPMSAHEVAQSIRREQGLPEPPDPDEPEYWEVRVEKMVAYTVKATDAEDAIQRYYDGHHLGEETIDEHVYIPDKLRVVKKGAL